ncbi:MAG TPA: Ig-like domain repeat protein [Acidimicrobiales bacterium]|nr:Ig-like domain repeat protein [Acidimicrobiales bacterium]
MDDFDQLFSESTEWSAARDRIGIYRVHAWQVREALTDDQLRTMIEYLDRHDIPLMLETEPLTYPNNAGCVFTESFSGVNDLAMAERIRDLGGTIAAVAIEEPFHFVHKLDGPRNCRWSVERIVDEVIDYMDQMRAMFPDAVIGSIEPIWSSPETTPHDMEIWLDTWEERSGEPFAFLHIDPDWSRPDWPEVALGIEAVADARDVPFGVLYNGGLETDGESWMQFTMENIARFEEEYGGTPQHVSFQSWVDQPRRALPPDDPGALTSGIIRYFGERTRLEVTSDPRDGTGVAVNLTTTDGTPVPDAPLDLSAVPRDGALGTTTVTGTVPEGAAEAVIVIRVNTENAIPGPADVRIAGISYSEARGPNLVVNGDFAGGLGTWGFRGSPMGVVRRGGDAGRTWVEITADPEQVVLGDSPVFTVTPGSEFEFEATFGIDQESVESVAVAIEFLDVARVFMDMRPPRTELTSVVTGADGSADLPAGVLQPGLYTIEAHYSGDLDHWPSTGSVEVTIG